MNRVYPGKVMLFGEYGVIVGGPAMAVPWHHYSASWTTPTGGDQNTGELDIAHFCAYLESINDREVASPKLDLRAIRNDLENNIYLASNIPIGQGIGSSGALTAALFNRYDQLSDREQLDALKTKLGLIESYFHGQSSGLDPLVSLLQKPIVSDIHGRIKALQLDLNKLRNFHLIQTGLSRSTKPLVTQFTQMLNDPELDFHLQLKETYLPCTQAAIQSVINGDETALIHSIKCISDFQVRFMQPMILPGIHGFWKEMIHQELGYVKLCGAGGGGFYLIYVPNHQDLSSVKKHSPYPILSLI